MRSTMSGSSAMPFAAASAATSASPGGRAFQRRHPRGSGRSAGGKAGERAQPGDRHELAPLLGADVLRRRARRCRPPGKGSAELAVMRPSSSPKMIVLISLLLDTMPGAVTMRIDEHRAADHPLGCPRWRRLPRPRSRRSGSAAPWCAGPPSAASGASADCEVVQLHCMDNQINCFLELGCRRDFHGEGFLRTCDRKAVAADRLEMLAAADQRHVEPRSGRASRRDTSRCRRLP